MTKLLHYWMVVSMVYHFTGLSTALAAPEPEAPPFERTEQREDCSDYNPQKNVYWGDLHNHTSYSSDVVLFGVWNDPRDAYRFASGEKVGLMPYDEDGKPLRQVQLVRPLDFNAVTDHSEFFAEVQICLTCKKGDEPCRECLSDPDDDGETSEECEALFVNQEVSCKIFRAGVAAALQTPGDEAPGNLADLLWAEAGWSSTNPERFSWCGDQGFNCLAASANVWSDIQQAAEEAYDRTSSCAFTSFVAYEWTGMPLSNNWHRNVIFRNDKVPGMATTNFETGPVTLDASNIQNLWSDLQSNCLDDTPGCDVLTIPHNANLSGGGLFRTPSSSRDAETQATWEPLTEIHQIKGNSECRWGVGTEDELCRFELVSKENFQVAAAGPGNETNPMPATDQGFPLNATTKSYHSFIREVLKGGLVLGQEDSGVGVNPYKLGFVGGNDQHNGTPGATQTWVWDRKVSKSLDWPGHNGVKDDTAEKRLSEDDSTHEHLEYNPGGLTAIWAEENSRDALFTSLRNKEVYATSGTRPAVRFFGGWGFDEDLCNRHDFVATGYREGVPMGSDLESPPPGATSPRFAVQALQDLGTPKVPGTPLQRIQIVKGWIDAYGTLHEKVFDVAPEGSEGDFPPAERYVDLDTCEAQPDAPGNSTLCSVWTDPGFDPSQPAFYYARVLENPTCRWSTEQCLDLGGKKNPCWERIQTPANCENPRPGSDGERVCDNPESAGVVVGYTAQQRAWTSPIWYETGKVTVTISAREDGSGAEDNDDSSDDGEEVSRLARWRLDQGETSTPWQVSGDTLDNVAPGEYIVEFNTIPGWTPPGPRPVFVRSGESAQIPGENPSQQSSATYTKDSESDTSGATGPRNTEASSTEAGR